MPTIGLFAWPKMHKELPMTETLKYYLASQFASKLTPYSEMKTILLSKAIAPAEINEIYELILEYDTIGQKAFYNKYKGHKLW